MSCYKKISLFVILVSLLQLPAQSQEMDALFDSDSKVLAVQPELDADKLSFVTVASLQPGESIPLQTAELESKSHQEAAKSEDLDESNSIGFFQQSSEATPNVDSPSLLKANTAQNGIQLASLQLFAVLGLVGGLFVGGVFLRNVAIARSEFAREHWG